MPQAALVTVSKTTQAIGDPFTLLTPIGVSVHVSPGGSWISRRCPTFLQDQADESPPMGTPATRRHLQGEFNAVLHIGIGF